LLGLEEERIRVLGGSSFVTKPSKGGCDTGGEGRRSYVVYTLVLAPEEMDVLHHHVVEKMKVVEVVEGVYKVYKVWYTG
jgi:hypothetical protein